MLKEKRWELIRRMVENQGIVSNTQLMDALHVSDMTIRRDLDALQKAGELIRYHGGAKSLKTAMEQAQKEKREKEGGGRHALVRKAASLIQDGDLVFLCHGPLMEVLAEALRNRKVLVYTNSLPVFEKLRSHPDKVILAGGRFHPATSSFQGPVTLEILDKVHFQKAFLSTTPFEGDSLVCSDWEQSLLLSHILNHSQQRYLLQEEIPDSRGMPYDFYPLCGISGWIIPAALEEQLPETIRSHLLCV